MQGNQHIESFMHNIQKLEKVDISCKGEERIKILRQLLALIEQVERNKKYFNSRDNVELVDANDNTSKHQEIQHVSHYKNISHIWCNVIVEILSLGFLENSPECMLIIQKHY